MQEEFSHSQIEPHPVALYQQPMALTLHIREIREDRGLTLAQLASKIGVSVPHLSGVERGIKNVNNHLLERLSVALQVPPDQLISGVDPDAFRRLGLAMRKLSPEDQARVEAFAEALVHSQQGFQRSE